MAEPSIMFYDCLKANDERRRLEREAYRKTTEYRAQKAKYLKRLVRRQRVKKEVLFIDDTTDIEFKDDEAEKNWKLFVEINSKVGYSDVVTYARRWAKYMQHLMYKHDKSVSEIAFQTSYVTNIEYITEPRYGFAVDALAKFWKYGEYLRNWHNKEYGY